MSSGTSGGALPQRKPHLLRLWEPLVFEVGRAVEMHGPPPPHPRGLGAGLRDQPSSAPWRLTAEAWVETGDWHRGPGQGARTRRLSRPTEGDDVHAQLPGVAGAELAAQPLSPTTGARLVSRSAHAGPLTQQPPHATAR